MQLRLCISHVQVNIESDLDDFISKARLLWGSCVREWVPTRDHWHYEVKHERGEYQIKNAWKILARTASTPDLLPTFERVLYQAIRYWHREATLLHAACLRIEGRPVVLLGESGAGKSTLALTALSRGARYWSDELCVSNGREVWGIPRAIQFDPTPPGQALPPWLQGLDLSYTLRSREGQTLCIPLRSPPLSQLPMATDKLADALLVVPRRGTCQAMRPMSPLAALEQVQRGALSCARSGLGGFVGAGRCWSLEWDCPRTAMDRIYELVG